MATAGPNFPGTGADDATVGTLSWNTPTAITADDAANAFRALASSAITHYLKGTGFGFAIPTGSTINGILLEIKRDRTSAAGANVDSEVKLVKGGVIGSTNKADTSTVWPLNVLTYASYGALNDLWGDTWTVADINSATFGAVLAATNPSGTSTNSSVDAFRISVGYTPPASSAVIAAHKHIFQPAVQTIG